MFTGIHEHTIDKKGRTSLPARYRNALIDGAYISVGIDKNLVIYPIEYFEALGKEISSFSLADPIARKYRRRMFSKAELIEFDANGRFLVPPYLRDEFNFQDGDKIIFTGSDEYIELWTAEGWKQAEAETFHDENVTEEFAKLLSNRYV
ncbi:MAG: division/cell wall cluster transcriptional repressor MraZ [Chloroflexi bacterium]|mgnify:CR=1 FL=1|jgi:MraZ protein|nr:division/cell wall cluster transcriptional repressor MraZ [Chloroflexota bacterium]